MKALLKDQKYIVSILLTTLLFIGTFSTGYIQAQNVGEPITLEIVPVSERTPQVRDAIVAAVPGVDAAADVTATHLATITALYLNNRNITSLKSSDFDGLLALTLLDLRGNQLMTLPEDVFSGLSTLTLLTLSDNQLTVLPEKVFSGLLELTELYLRDNQLTELPAGVFSGLSELRELALYNNQLTTLPDGVFNGLTILRLLSLYNNQLTTLPEGVFNELSELTWLYLHNNRLTELPAGVFSGLSALTEIDLRGNAVNPLPLTISLEKVAAGQFKAVAPTGAPFNIVLPLYVTNGTISGGATTITIPVGSVESETLTVTRTIGTSGAVSVWVGPLPSLPARHAGYRLVENIGRFNRLIIFEDISEPVWSATVTVGTWGNAFNNGNATGYGYSSRHNAGSISNPTFTYRGTVYTIHGIGTSYIGNRSIISLVLTISPAFPPCDKNRLKFLGIQLSDASGPGGTHEGYATYYWYGPGGVVVPRWPGYQFIAQLILQPAVPEAPILAAINEGNQVMLSWTTPCDGGKDITGHEYRQRIGSGTFGPWIPIPSSATGEANSTSYTVTNVSNQLESTFEVRAVNELGPSLPSNVAYPVSLGFIPVSARTPQVRDAIVAAVPGVNSAAAVTETHLAGITALNLRNRNITSLKASDFDGLSSLERLVLEGNQLTTLPSGIFDGLTALTWLDLGPNRFTTLPSGIFNGLTALETLDLSNNQFTTLPEDIFDGLTALRTLALHVNRFTTLPAGIFDKLSLLSLGLYANQLTAIPEGLFSGLFSVASLNLSRNVVDPLPLTISLEKVVEGQFKATASTGAPFDIVLPLSIANGSIDSGATTITIPTGGLESEVLTVTRTSGRTYAATVDIGTLPGLPANHSGYTFVKSADLPLVFTELGGRVFTPVSQRTPQVRDAIVAAVPGVNSANGVTAAHLAAIKHLYFQLQNIKHLKTGDFGGLTALTSLNLAQTQLSTLPADIFEGLTSLTWIRLDGNQLVSLPADLFEGLTALENIQLHSNQLSSLPSDLFEGLTSLTYLTLNNNQLSSLPDGIFEGLTALRTVRLVGNAVDPVPLTVSVEKVADGQFKVVVPTGAPFEIVLPLTVTNGSLSGGVTTVTIPVGSVESAVLTVTRTPGTTSAVAVNIGQLPTPPRTGLGRPGYVLVKSDDLPLTIITDVSEQQPAPKPDLVVEPVEVVPSTVDPGQRFRLYATLKNNGTAESDATIVRYYRSTDDIISAEDTQLGTGNRNPLAANDSIRRYLAVTAPTTPGTYYYGVCVDSVPNESDTTNNCSAAVSITVQGPAPKPDLVVEPVEVVPSTVDPGQSFRLYATLKNNGTAESDATIVRYYRSTDDIISTEDTQLGRASRNPLAADASIRRYLTVTAPTTPGTYYYGVCVDSVPNESDITNNCSVAVSITVQQPAQKPDLVVEQPTVSKSTLTPGENFTLSVTVKNQEVGSAAATTLRYYRSTDATISTSDTEVGTASVSGLGANESSAASITLTAPTSAGTYYYGACVDAVADESSSDNNCSTAVRITVQQPPIVSTPSHLRMYWTDEDTAKIQRANLDGSNVEDLVTRTQGLREPRGITLDVAGGKMYWTDKGTGKIQRANLDASNVEDLVTQGLREPLSIALDMVGGKMYWTDFGPNKIQRANLDGSNVEDLAVGDSSSSIALDVTGGKMYWTTRTTASRIRRANLDGSNIQDLVIRGLNAPNGIALDVAGGKMYWTDGGADKIQRANLDGSNVEDLVIRGLSVPIGVALDVTGSKMYWTDSGADKIQRANLDGSNVEDLVTGLQYPSGIALDTASQAIPPTPDSTNNAPEFTEGDSTTRTIAEKTAANTNIGDVISATDADSSDTLTYTLGGTDAASFSIISTSGQLQTNTPLDYETKTSYMVTVTVSDGNNGNDSIDVTINITDVDDAAENDAPVFTDGTSTTRAIAENTAAGEKIGDPVSATDADNDVLTYSLSGTDAASFSIDSATGQLQTSAELDYETKTSYTVTVSVSDVDAGRDSIIVTINITDIDEDTESPASIGPFECTVINRFGNTLEITISGTITANQPVRINEISGSINDDYLGIDFGIIPFRDLDRGESYRFFISGFWTHDGSQNAECSVEASLQRIAAPAAPSVLSVPLNTTLLPNYPNPFNPETWIPYHLANDGDVLFSIYDINGALVRELDLGHQRAGYYTDRTRAAYWDGRNEWGEQVATGIYFYQLRTGDYLKMRKMVIMK